jgi:transposase-like protein
MTESIIDHRVKLTDEEVAEIRRRYSQKGALQSELARQYGVAQTTISQLVNFKIRREVSRVPARSKRRAKNVITSTRKTSRSSETTR